MNRWLENTANKVTSRYQDDLTPFLKKAKEAVDRNWTKKSTTTTQLSDFELIKTLGQGSFGKVMLVRDLRTNRNFFAMKIMSKKKLIMQRHVENIIFERKILQAIKFPFLIEYITHFKNNANVFIVLEYAPGGDMHLHLSKLIRFDEDIAVFYAAQVVLAFEYLHFVGIIYRDLKPENLVIDARGYLKLTDFGYAKKIDRKKTKTMCGTPEYFAPEMLKRKAYSFAVDWYTLGILMYEMIEGHPPYRSSNTMKLYEMILVGNIKFSSYFSDAAVNIIRSLTRQSTSLRLVNPKRIKQRDFFEDINWRQLYDRVARPPYQPEVRGENDTRNFIKLKEEPLDEESEPIYVNEFKEF